jgi:hypothetical protein
MDAKCAVIIFSTAAGSKSPTAITVIRSGLGLADRQPLGVVRALQHDRQLLVLDAGERAPAHAPLFLDDAALLVDLDGIQRQAVRPVLENQERPVEHVGLVGRHLQHVDGLVEARIRVDARAEAHAERFEELDRRLLRKVLRAVERHVLEKVRQPELVLVLDNGADVDDQPQLGALLGLLRRADEIAEAVREAARLDGRIERNLLGGRGRLARRADGGGKHERNGVTNRADQHAALLNESDRRRRPLSSAPPAR